MNSKNKNTEYLDLNDSRYSVLSKVTNTALGVGSLMGIGAAKRKLKSRATKFAMNKVADGASGIIATKTGVDKSAVKSVMDGAGQLTGATKGIHKGINKGMGSTKAGSMYNSAKDYAAKQRLKVQRSFGSGPSSTDTGSNS